MVIDGVATLAMTNAKPPAFDDGTEEMARQLDVLRMRSHRVDREVHRIRDELVELIDRIDSHFSSGRRAA